MGTLYEDLNTFMIFRSVILIKINASNESCSENQNIHSIPFFRKSCRLWDNDEKCGGAREAADDNITRRMRFACWVSKATRERARAYNNEPAHPHKRTHEHTLTHPRVRAHTRTQKYVILFFLNGNNDSVNAPQYYVPCPFCFDYVF